MSTPQATPANSAVIFSEKTAAWGDGHQIPVKHPALPSDIETSAKGKMHSKMQTQTGWLMFGARVLAEMMSGERGWPPKFAF